MSAKHAAAVSAVSAVLTSVPRGASVGRRRRATLTGPEIRHLMCLRAQVSPRTAPETGSDLDRVAPPAPVVWRWAHGRTAGDPPPADRAAKELGSFVVMGRILCNSWRK